MFKKLKPQYKVLRDDHRQAHGTKCGFPITDSSEGCDELILNFRFTFHKFTLMLFQQPLILVAGGELRGGVNPLRDRLKLDNCVTQAMWVVMKPVRVASNRHLRNWEATDALVQEIIPVAS